MNNNELTLTK